MSGPRQNAIKPILKQRAQIMAAIRHYLASHDYLEIETPLRIPAPAPEAHIDPEPSGSWYLHTSPELCMKRLLAAGYDRIYQLCKCFRKNERGGRHLPELTLLEWYTAGEDYHHMMAQTESLLLFVLQSLARSPQWRYQERRIDLTPPWPRLSVAEAFAAHGDCSVAQALTQQRFDEVMGLQIEPQLGWPQPVFLHDYPAACGALARLKPGQPEVVERFELYIGGLELCNGFSELTDPEEQRRRFEAEIHRRRTRGQPSPPLPEPFLAALPHLPAATGNALGIDRLVMLLTNSATIDEVVAFTPEEL